MVSFLILALFSVSFIAPVLSAPILVPEGPNLRSLPQDIEPVWAQENVARAGEEETLSSELRYYLEDKPKTFHNLDIVHVPPGEVAGKRAAILWEHFDYWYHTGWRVGLENRLLRIDGKTQKDLNRALKAYAEARAQAEADGLTNLDEVGLAHLDDAVNFVTLYKYDDPWMEGHVGHPPALGPELTTKVVAPQPDPPTAAIPYSSYHRGTGKHQTHPQADPVARTAGPSQKWNSPGPESGPSRMGSTLQGGHPSASLHAQVPVAHATSFWRGRAPTSLPLLDETSNHFLNAYFPHWDDAHKLNRGEAEIILRGTIWTHE